MQQQFRVAPVHETQLEVLTSYLRDDSDKRDEVTDRPKIHLAVTSPMVLCCMFKFSFLLDFYGCCRTSRAGGRRAICVWLVGVCANNRIRRPDS